MLLPTMGRTMGIKQGFRHSGGVHDQSHRLVWSIWKHVWVYSKENKGCSDHKWIQVVLRSTVLTSCLAVWQRNYELWPGVKNMEKNGKRGIRMYKVYAPHAWQRWLCYPIGFLPWSYMTYLEPQVVTNLSGHGEGPLTQDSKPRCKIQLGRVHTSIFDLLETADVIMLWWWLWLGIN